uniref:Bidirectional sugar transporter SWEET n=1 Tax=Litchi chinensis TaxID=151069 RepID=A0A6C0G8V7_LITCN|nr:sugar efflux transporter 5 [Litchi chinensis]
MVDTGAVRTVIGVLGNVISFGLFVSPVPTMVTIVKAKSVQEFKSDPYVATLFNCMLWVFYGLPIVRPDTILVSTINGCGVCIELAYIIIFLLYSPASKKKRILISVFVEVIVFAILVFVTLKFLHTTKARSALIGILCIIFNVIMYASPLTVMRMVIQTKSVKYMPFLLSLANFCNGLVWLVYALLKFDPFIVIPNGLGAFFGVIQLALYGTYYRSTKWDEDDTRPGQKSEVELTNT